MYDSHILQMFMNSSNSSDMKIKKKNGKKNSNNNSSMNIFKLWNVVFEHFACFWLF